MKTNTSSASEPEAPLTLTRAQEDSARLFGAFQMAIAAVPTGTPKDEGFRIALWECFTFVSALAVNGGGTEEDLGRLVRMHEALKEREEARRAQVVWIVEQALASNDVENRAGNLRFLASLVEGKFAELSLARFQEELGDVGRRKPPAIAARLSIACNAFGDRGDVTVVTDRFRNAAKALRKSGRKHADRHADIERPADALPENRERDPEF